MIPIKIGTAFSHSFGPFVSSTDGYTLVTALGMGTSDVRINTNGAAAWVSKSTATTNVYQELGYYRVTFTSTDFTVQGHHRVAISMTSAGGALPVWEDFWASETSELAVALTSGARSTAIDLIWDEAYSGHATAGTPGYVLGTNLLTPTSAAVLSAAGVNAVTTAIWAEALASHTTAGGAGKKLSDLAMSTDMGTALTNITAIQAKTTNLPATPASSTSFLNWAMSTDMATALTNITAIQAKTTNLPATPASSTDAMRLATTAIDLIWDEEVVVGHATTNTAGERLAAASAAAGLGTTAVRDAVWNAARATYASTGTFGELIDAMWDESLAGHGTTNTAGERLATAAVAAASSDPWSISTTGTAYTSTQFGGRLNATVSSRASSTDIVGTTGIRDAVWNAVRATYATAGTFGEVTASSDLVDDIWDEPTTGHGTTNTMGERLFAAASGASTGVDPWAISTTGTAYTSTQFGGRLDAVVSSRASSTAILNWAMSTDMASVLTASSAIQAKTTNLPATPASSTDAMRLATTALDLIWDEAFAGHVTAGTFGVNLQSPTSGVLLTAAGVQAVTTSVWAEALASHTTAGAAGKKLSDLAMSTDMASVLTASSQIQAKTTNLPATPASSTSFLNWAMSTDMASVLTASSQIQAKTTNLPATPASSTDILAWAMSTDMGTALTALSAIEAATTLLPAAPAGSSNFTTLMTSTGSTQMADAVWNVISESTQTHADQIRTMRSALAGKATGGGTATIKFRDVADTIDRITLTATTAGNRTAVVLVTT